MLDMWREAVSFSQVPGFQNCERKPWTGVGMSLYEDAEGDLESRAGEDSGRTPKF